MKTLLPLRYLRLFFVCNPTKEESHGRVSNCNREDIALLERGTVPWRKCWQGGSVLRKDKIIIVMAAAQAQKAADFILNRKGGEEELVNQVD